MRLLRISSLLQIVTVVAACAPAQQAEPPPAAPVAQIAPAPEPPPAPAPAPLSAEEQKKLDEQKKLEKDFAELEKAHQEEVARITPEVRAAAKALSDKAYPSTRAALTAALAGPQRAAKSAARDKDRHPLETLEFLGVKPNSKVLEVGPGEGWYTELLAPTLAKNGKLYVTSGDPNAPKDQRPTLYSTRTKLFLERLPEAYGKVETVVIDSKAPKLPQEAALDVVLLFRGAHGMVNNGTLNAHLAEFHRALKPNGTLGIEQHRGPAGGDIQAMSKKGYLPEAWLIEQVTSAGFKLAAKSEINANPKDTKDYPEGVWSLPPSLREGDKDRAKYVAIGETDRMTLKFVKVALKPTAAAVPAKAAPPAASPAPAKAAAPAAAPTAAPAPAKATAAPAPAKATPAAAAAPTPPAPAKPTPPAATPPK